MKRLTWMSAMGRRLLATLAVLSLLLCMVMASVWCDAKHMVPLLPFIRLDSGPVRAVGFSNVGFRVDIAIRERPEPGVVIMSDQVSFISFGPLHGIKVTGHYTLYIIYTPYPWLIPFTLVAPGFWLWTWDRRRRLRRLAASGCCLQCGYDLRASKERCPECGTPVPPQTSCSATHPLSASGEARGGSAVHSSRPPAERRRMAVRFLTFQLLFTAVVYAVVLSGPVDPRRIMVLAGISCVTLIYMVHVLAVFRGTRPPA